MNQDLCRDSLSDTDLQGGETGGRAESKSCEGELNLNRCWSNLWTRLIWFSDQVGNRADTKTGDTPSPSSTSTTTTFPFHLINKNIQVISFHLDNIGTQFIAQNQYYNSDRTDFKILK